MSIEKTFCPYGSLMACEFLRQDKSRGGIMLPDKGSDGITESAGEVQKAIVVAVGPEVKYYKPGDTVLIRAGTFLKHEGVMYAMVPESETFGCANRELDPLPLAAAVQADFENKLKSMIFEEASKIVAGLVKRNM